MVDAAMMEVGNIECVVGPERVCVDDTVRLHLLLDDRQQGLCPGVRNDRRIDLPTPLQKPENSHFSRSATPTLAFANTAEIALVGLHFTAQPIAGQLAGNQLTQPHEKTDRRVGLNANDLGSGASRAAGNKMLNQLTLLTGR